MPPTATTKRSPARATWTAGPVGLVGREAVVDALAVQRGDLRAVRSACARSARGRSSCAWSWRGSVVLMTSAPPRSALVVPPTKTPASPIQPSTSWRRSRPVCFWNWPSSALTPTPVIPPPPATVCSDAVEGLAEVGDAQAQPRVAGQRGEDVGAAAAGASRTCGVPMLTASTRRASGWACRAAPSVLGAALGEGLHHRRRPADRCSPAGRRCGRGPGRRGRRGRCGPGRPWSARRVRPLASVERGPCPWRRRRPSGRPRCRPRRGGR